MKQPLSKHWISSKGGYRPMRDGKQMRYIPKSIAFREFPGWKNKEREHRILDSLNWENGAESQKDWDSHNSQNRVLERRKIYRECWCLQRAPLKYSENWFVHANEKTIYGQGEKSERIREQSVWHSQKVRHTHKDKLKKTGNSLAIG